MEDPCETTSMVPYGLPRGLRAKKNKGDQYLVLGPYSNIDLQTAEHGTGKCGEVMCMAYFADHETSPDYLHVNNRVYNSIDNTYNTQLVLKPIESRDTSGTYEVFIDCEFIEYPDLNVFSQQIEVEILERSQCAPGEGGTNDSSCSDSSEEVQSDDDLGNGVSADDSSNDGYSGNDMNSSDSSGDGPSLGDNVTSDTTGDGPSDDNGGRRLREDDGITDVELNVELNQTEDERISRKSTVSSKAGKAPRSKSVDAAAREYSSIMHGKNTARKELASKKMREPAAERRQLQPQMISSNGGKSIRNNSVTNNCPTGQYMSKDSNKCALCLPRALFVDRLRRVDLAQNSIAHKDCPSSQFYNSIETSCVLQNMMNFSAEPVTLEDCKIPEKTLSPNTMYKLTVAFKQNGILSSET